MIARRFGSSGSSKFSPYHQLRGDSEHSPIATMSYWYGELRMATHLECCSHEKLWAGFAKTGTACNSSSSSSSN